MDAIVRFGNLVRDARLKCGVSQSYVSAKLGQKSDAYISRIENGRQKLATKHAGILAIAIGVNLSTIIEMLAEIRCEEIRRFHDNTRS